MQMLSARQPQEWPPWEGRRQTKYGGCFAGGPGSVVDNSSCSTKRSERVNVDCAGCTRKSLATAGDLQTEFHEDDIEPAIELETDFRKVADLDKSGALMETKTDVRLGIDAGDDRVEAQATGLLDQGSQQ